MAKKQAEADPEMRKMNRTVEAGKKQRSKINSTRPSQIIRAILAATEPKDLADVVDQMNEDYQVQLAYRSIKAIIKTAQISVTVEDADSLDPVAREKADWLAGMALELFQSRWSDMLEFIPYGRVAFEKVWKLSARKNCYYLDDLDPLPYRQTEMLLTTKTHESGAGRFAGIRLTVEGKDPLDLKEEEGKAWWLALDPDAVNPYGKSRFMGAPKKVWEQRKEQFIREQLFEDKLLFNGAVAHLPDEPIPENGYSIEPMAALEQAMNDYRAGGIVQLPNDRDDNGNYHWDVTLPAGMTDASPIINLIGMTDVHMLRAFGLLEKCIVEGDSVGSYAMVSLQMLIVRAMCDEIFDQIKKSFQEFCLDKTAQINGLGEAKLKISSPKLAQVPDSMLIEIAKTLLTASAVSPITTSGAIDILSIMEAVGIPVSDTAKIEIDAMVSRLKNAPAASGPPGGTFANPQFPGEGNDLLSGLPTLDQLIEAANAEAASLWDDLIDCLGRLHQTAGHESPFKAEAILNQIRSLQADTLTAARLMGMVSIGRPEINSTPPGSRGIQRAILLSNPIGLTGSQPIVMAGGFVEGVVGTAAIRYPFLSDAIAWLQEKKLATADEVKAMAAADKTSVFTAAGTNSIPTLQILREEISNSIQIGESFDGFRNRMKDTLSGTRAQQETLYRTNTKQAYNAGMEKTLDDPEVSDTFGYVLYAATTDNRTRGTHWMLDGFVCSRSDPAYDVLQAAVNDWNCRCSLIPLTKRQAEQRGIKTKSDMPAEVLAKYG